MTIPDCFKKLIAEAHQMAASDQTFQSNRDKWRWMMGELIKLQVSVTAERDRLKGDYEKAVRVNATFKTIEAERDALRAELARQAAVIVELNHQRQTASAEIDRLDAIRRQQEQDNLDLIEKAHRCDIYEDALRKAQER